MNTVPSMFLTIARDEIETLMKYNDMVELDTNKEDQRAKEIVHEIMGDEFNHALISLLSAAKALDIKIATDDLIPDPNEMQVE